MFPSCFWRSQDLQEGPPPCESMEISRCRIIFRREYSLLFMKESQAVSGKVRLFPFLLPPLHPPFPVRGVFFS